MRNWLAFSVGERAKVLTWPDESLAQTACGRALVSLRSMCDSEVSVQAPERLPQEALSSECRGSNGARRA